MPQYGEVRVDFITYTTGVAPNEGNVTVPISGLINAPTFSGDVVIEGDLTVSGDIIASGVTISGITGLFASGTAAAPSISFVGDADTGFYNAAANEVRITTSGNDRLRISSNGQVNIAGLGSAATPALVFGSDPNTGIYSPGADQVAVATNGAGRLFVDANGNVGINATSPAGRLGVDGSVVIGNQLSTGTTTGTLRAVQSTSSVYLQTGLNTTTGSSADLGFSNINASNEWMRLTSAGRLGIGTSSPDTALHLASASPVFRFENPATTSTTGTSMGKIEWETRDSSAPGVIGYIDVVDSNNFGTAFDMQLATGISGAATTKVTIKADGKVGIGTTSPDEKLEVYKGNIKLGSDDNTTQKIIFERSAAERASIYVDSGNVLRRTALAHAWFNAADTTEYARIDSSGRLLVGTSSARTFAGITSAYYQQEGTFYQNASAAWSLNQNSTDAPWLVLAKSRGTSDKAVDLVNDGDSLGIISFQGADGSSLIKGAEIKAQVDGTPGTNDMPGRLVLATTADGASSPTERMRITSDGSVGIGTSTPATRLHVEGTNNAECVRFDGNSGAENRNLVFTNANNSLRWIVDSQGAGTSGELWFQTNSTTRLAIGATGNVGIGTSSPSVKLTISDTGTTPGLNTYNGGNLADITSFAARAGLELISYQSDSGSPYTKTSALIANSDGTVPSEMQFWTKTSGQSSPAERLRIDSSGRVGIGTTSPQQLLHLSQTTGDTMIHLYSNTGFVSRLQVTGSDTFAINTGFTERLRIDSSGRLLVGTSTSLAIGSPTNAQIQQANTTSTPNLALANFVNASAGSYLILGASRGTSIGSYTAVANNDRIATIRFAAADGTDLQSLAGAIECYAEADAASNDTPGRLVFSVTADGASSPTERMRISANGYIHMGPSAPSPGNAETLRVQTRTSTDRALVCRTSNNSFTSLGLVQFLDGDSHSCGEIIINTVANTTNYSTSSDYRLKENIGVISNAFSRLKALKPCSFNFISAPDTRFDGFLAHEVQTIVPEAITGEKDAVDDDGNPVYQGIDQSKLVPLLTAALQEAVAKIEVLEQRLNDAGIN